MMYLICIIRYINKGYCATDRHKGVYLQAVAVQVSGLGSMQRVLSRRDSMKKYV